MTFESLTPEEIERTTFPRAEQGYDMPRVDSFVRTMAEQVRELNRRLEILADRDDKPYFSLGREMGDLLDHANRVARNAIDKAERQAAELLEEARSASEEATRDLSEARQKAEQEAEEVLRKAHTDATRLRERAADVRRLVEAEATVLRQEAQREARQLKSEAKKEAQRIRASSESESAAVIRDLERRIRKLQEMEVLLRRKIRSMAESASPQSALPKTIPDTS